MFDRLKQNKKNALVQFGDLEPILDELRKISNMKIEGAERHGDYTWSVPRNQQTVKGGGGGEQTTLVVDTSIFFAEITNSHGADATNYGGSTRYYRWKYEFREVIKSDQMGYNGVFGQPGTLTRTGTAYNLGEWINTFPSVNNSPILGNGVAFKQLIDNFPGMNIQPAPIGTIVLMRQTNPNTPALSEFWFQYENAIDGSC